MTQKQIDERDEVLSSNIIKWCISYFDMITCYVVLEAHYVAYDQKTVSNRFNAECNTMIRRLSKFRDYLSDMCYLNTNATIIGLRDDYTHRVKQELRKDGLI